MLDKASIDLDHIDRHLANMVERRISGSEIVQCDLDTERLNLTQNAFHMFHIVNRKTFRHFQCQIARIDPCIINHLFDLLDDIVLQQLYNRQINIHFIIRMSHIVPVFATLRCLLQHKLTDRIDQSQILCKRDKIFRTDKAKYT